MTSAYSGVEQDQSSNPGGNELPTYDDLAQQNGPNSRFGRWRGWIEKRAAERYNDVTPQELNQRRARGWDIAQSREPGASENPTLTIVNQPATPALHITTTFASNGGQPAFPEYDILPEPSPPLPPLPAVLQDIAPSNLKLKQFGSRFLPHATSTIRCLLPLPSHELLLIGHDEGLSVLDMFPQETTEDGDTFDKGPDEAQMRMIWKGESVLQMDMLEMDNRNSTRSQGVVLMLLAPDADCPSREGESNRFLRMYNLTSLVSLAKWAVGQQNSAPLDLKRPANWNAQQSPIKKTRPPSSLSRGLKHFRDASNSSEHSSSYQTLLTKTTTALSNLSVESLQGHRGGSPQSPKRTYSEESWDLVEDLPLRWATDFVPLASPGTRLANASVVSYALFSDGVRKNGQLLAIATKSNIFLYETPRGERAFRFVKEFYTPLHPRSISFYYQSVNEVSRSSSTIHPPSNSARGEASTSNRRKSASFSPSALDYGPQLSLFVIFDKKASWIRLADAAVGEIELFDDGTIPYLRGSAPSSSRLSIRMSMVDHGPNHGKWIAPVQQEISMPPNDRHPTGWTKKLMILSRGRVSHILPSPLPASGCQPLCIVSWKYTPSTISTRLHYPSQQRASDITGCYLQLVALGEDGLEVQELPLSSFGKGKGKSRGEEPVRAEFDLAGSASFLCAGGIWGFLDQRGDLQRSFSTTSTFRTWESTETEDMHARLKQQEGIYIHCRRGPEDHRVLWVGGGG